ncbi:hypothetical protein D9758_013387 [Tetrapyrgos nigripes]|uniref:GST N-terminal domain-containing protein n=1 Tax=Tetrapyrgos nigripes TaxID=182062 RepID=A0A8H5CJE3_9AGAR|nr:hypothetical protein D9758_013387 [Tetrapyrgos nigripes]
MASIASKRILRPSIRPTFLHLYTAPYSGCSARVRITAALKKIPEKIKMEYHTIDYRGGEHQEEAYKKLNPNMSLPTLVVEYPDGEETRSITITQSLAILDWLEHWFPEPALLPSVNEEDPASWADRARIWELASLVACDIQPPQSTRIPEED